MRLIDADALLEDFGILHDNSGGCSGCQYAKKNHDSCFIQERTLDEIWLRIKINGNFEYYLCPDCKELFLRFIDPESYKDEVESYKDEVE